MANFDLTGKIAVITGAASGFGPQFVAAVANQGADTAIIDCCEDKLNLLASEIRKTTGKKCKVCLSDMSDDEAGRSEIPTIKSEYGRVDILVNNVYLPPEDQNAEEDVSYSQWDKFMLKNFEKTIGFTRKIGKLMVEHKYGRIINSFSVLGWISGPGELNYFSARTAIESVTTSLAGEFAKYKIPVNCIIPGIFKTDLTERVINEDAEQMKVFMDYSPLRRIGAEGELDSSLIYLSSGASVYMTGQSLCVDGGFSLMMI